MKIIESGKFDKNIYRIVCKNEECVATLEYQKRDIKQPNMLIMCPICEEFSPHSEDNLIKES